MELWLEINSEKGNYFLLVTNKGSLQCKFKYNISFVQIMCCERVICQRLVICAAYYTANIYFNNAKRHVSYIAGLTSLMTHNIESNMTHYSASKYTV